MASKSGVRGRGTKEAPLSVQSPRKRLDLGSSGEIQGNLCSLGCCFLFSFDADVDVTGSEVTTVGDTSFIVEEGEVTILDNKDDQDSDSYSDTSSDSDDPTLYVAVCFVFSFQI